MLFRNLQLLLAVLLMPPMSLVLHGFARPRGYTSPSPRDMARLRIQLLLIAINHAVTVASLCILVSAWF